MAGESADQLARRQREKAARLMRSAELYERGAQGERAVGRILDELRAQGWVVFHDVRWPGRVRANLDHVVVGPAGVFVIDAKNWSGRIQVRDDTFWCHGRRQDRVVAAASDAALAVAGIVSAPAAASVHSALCFVRDEPVAGWCHDVMLCSTANLREMLLTRPPVLTMDQVKLAGLELDLGFQAAARAKVVHAPVSRAPRPPRRPRARAARRSAVFVVAALVALTCLPYLPRAGEAVSRAIVDNMAPATSYETCAALRRAYPRGVGTFAAVDGLGGRPLPAIDDRTYRVNSALDTDGDGIACERGR